MNMEMNEKEYAAFAESRAGRSPLLKDMCFAFITGGAICVVGEAIQNGWTALGLAKNDALAATSVSLVALSALLTGLNLYNSLARFGGAGTLVPITGFANAVVSPAIEFRSEGFVTGMATKMFLIAGPVIVFGVLSSALYGIALMLLGMA
jgi:stage V sporulation protein AC